jgi:tRNA1Val (adenine37-N6)-methyltransferase
MLRLSGGLLAEGVMMTTETPLPRGLRIRQKRKGYRFSIDAVVLAHHVSIRGDGVAVDLGTGCGIVPLILAHRFPRAQLYGIEIQHSLAELASTNVRLNHRESQIAILHADMKDSRSLIESGTADVVCSNPPYRKLHAGRLNPDPEKAVAKHEVKASLCDVLTVAETLLKTSGRVFVIYPADRATDLLTQMRAVRLEPKRLRCVHSKAHAEAELVVAEGTKAGKPGLKVAAPLFVHKNDGSYTDEMRAMLGM